MPVEENWFGDRIEDVYEEAFDEGNKAAAFKLQRIVKSKYLSGQSLNVRTGTLRRSIQVDDSDKKNIKVGTNVRYAAIHEFGGTIRGEGGKRIAIPIGKTVRKSGTSRKASPTEDTGLILVTRKGKPPLLVKKGKNGSFEPRWVLLSSVRMPARPYLRPALNENTDELNMAFLKAAKLHIKKALPE